MEVDSTLEGREPRLGDMHKIPLLEAVNLLHICPGLRFQNFWKCGGGSRVSQTGGILPLSLGKEPIIRQDFCQKLHENERNQNGGGGVGRGRGQVPGLLPWIGQYSG